MLLARQKSAINSGVISGSTTSNGKPSGQLVLAKQWWSAAILNNDCTHRLSRKPLRRKISSPVQRKWEITSYSVPKYSKTQFSDRLCWVIRFVSILNRTPLFYKGFLRSRPPIPIVSYITLKVNMLTLKRCDIMLTWARFWLLGTC